MKKKKTFDQRIEQFKDQQPVLFVLLLCALWFAVSYLWYYFFFRAYKPNFHEAIYDAILMGMGTISFGGAAIYALITMCKYPFTTDGRE